MLLHIKEKNNGPYNKSKLELKSGSSEFC